MTAKTKTIGAGEEKVKISANPRYQTKKMNTQTLCLLIRNLQAFEILKWAQGSQWRKQRPSNTTYIFTAMKYKFSIFSQLRNAVIFNMY